MSTSTPPKEFHGPKLQTKGPGKGLPHPVLPVDRIEEAKKESQKYDWPPLVNDLRKSYDQLREIDDTVPKSPGHKIALEKQRKSLGAHISLLSNGKPPPTGWERALHNSWLRIREKAQAEIEQIRNSIAKKSRKK